MTLKYRPSSSQIKGLLISRDATCTQLIAYIAELIGYKPFMITIKFNIDSRTTFISSWEEPWHHCGLTPAEILEVAHPLNAPPFSKSEDRGSSGLKIPLSFSRGESSVLDLKSQAAEEEDPELAEAILLSLVWSAHNLRANRRSNRLSSTSTANRISSIRPRKRRRQRRRNSRPS